MLTKSDLKAIDELLDKKFDVKFDQKLQPILSKELKPIKQSLSDLTDFIKQSIPPIFEWTNDIHNSIVKEKLPQRVKKLEHALKTS